MLCKSCGAALIGPCVGACGPTNTRCVFLSLYCVGEIQKITRREIASRRVSPTGRWRLLRTYAALLRQEVATISQGGSLPREGRCLSMLKKFPVPSLRSEAAAEPGEDHTPDTAHSGDFEVPF